MLYVACHPDPSLGKDIVLWDDIVTAFKYSLHIRNGARILPFLKGADFKSKHLPNLCVIRWSFFFT